MTRTIALLLVTLLTLASGTAHAQEPGLTTTEARIGERVVLTATLTAPTGADVVVDAVNPAWGALEVISSEVTREGAQVTIAVTVAPFATGEVTVQPAFLITTAGRLDSVLLDPLTLSVTPTLAPGAPLQISPLEGPQAIAGGRSPLLTPAIVASIALAIIVSVALLLRGAARYLLRRSNRSVPVPPSISDSRLGLDHASALMATDLVGAYRHLAALVRESVADHYSLPAEALTASELDSRLRKSGEPTTARLARDVLRECDAVVYGGYRPAPQRRDAAISMARQLIGPGLA